jgi:hypothetical protein
MFRFQLLQYVPDIVKGEFVNIGLVLTDEAGRLAVARMALEDDLRRARSLYPATDLELLRSWQQAVERELSARPAEAAAWLASLDEAASQALRFTPLRGYDSEDAAAAAEALYQRFVASPPRPSGRGTRPGTGPWVRREAESVLRAAHLLERLEREVPVEQFTWPGDPFRIHYAYHNGFPHYVHALSLARSVQQARGLAFTFERMARAGPVALTAVVESEPPASGPAQFTRQLLEQTGIGVLPLDRLPALVRRIKQDLQLN